MASGGFQKETPRRGGSPTGATRLIVLEKSKSELENRSRKALKYNNTAVRMYRGMKDVPAETLRFLDRAIQMDPFCDSCYLNKAVILYNWKEYARALESCNQAVRLNPQNPKAYLIRARCNLKLNFKESARYDYKMVCELGRIDFKTLMKIYKERGLDSE